MPRMVRVAQHGFWQRICGLWGTFERESARLKETSLVNRALLQLFTEKYSVDRPSTELQSKRERNSKGEQKRELGVGGGVKALQTERDRSPFVSFWARDVDARLR